LNNITWTEIKLESGTLYQGTDEAGHQYTVGGATERVMATAHRHPADLASTKHRSVKQAKVWCEQVNWNVELPILTEKETAGVLAIYNDQYSDGTLECSPWSWSVADGSKSMAGVLASLKDKNLVDFGDSEGKGRNRDQYVFFTELGKVVTKGLLSKLAATSLEVEPTPKPQDGWDAVLDLPTTPHNEVCTVDGPDHIFNAPAQAGRRCVKCGTLESLHHLEATRTTEQAAQALTAKTARPQANDGQRAALRRLESGETVKQAFLKAIAPAGSVEQVSAILSRLVDATLADVLGQYWHTSTESRKKVLFRESRVK